MGSSKTPEARGTQGDPGRSASQPRRWPLGARVERRSLLLTRDCVSLGETRTTFSHKGPVCLQNRRKLPMALIGSAARTRPTERARVRHGARTLSWPRDARATSLRALTRAVTLDQSRAPHSLLSCSPQPAPIAKLSLCENTGGTRYAGSRKERGEALRDSRAFCANGYAPFASMRFLAEGKWCSPKSHR